MTHKITFTGWNGAIADKVCEFLLPGKISGTVDLSSTLIVVPTLQAGRRLRETLAMKCASHNAGLLSTMIVTPSWFLHNSSGSAGTEISGTLAHALWAEILMNAGHSEYDSFLPSKGVKRDYAWALSTGKMMQGLRSILSDAGLSISGVAQAAGTELREPERWDAMGRLENKFLARIHDLGLKDPFELEIERAASPCPPEGVTRIVVAAVPAPTPLMLRALQNLAARIPVDILVHAPDDRKDCFDKWGEPLPEKWTNEEIRIPDSENSIILAASPEAQAEAAVGAIADLAKELGPSDIAIGVPDRSVIPFLESRLASHGLPAFDPAEKSVIEHPLYRLVESICRLLVDSSYEAFASLLRHPDMLSYLKESHGISATELLTELDQFQNLHLPLNFSYIAGQFQKGPYRKNDPREPDFEILGRTVGLVRKQLDTFTSDGVDTALRNFLGEVFSVRTLTDGEPYDDELKNVAGEVDTVLRELTAMAGTMKPDLMQSVSLLLDRLADLTYQREREQAVIDLEGWLELAWNSAPFLVVTGMNEGFVPDTRMGDVFLPNPLRHALGLPSDISRLGRDAYLMMSFIASRKEGHVVFIAGKATEEGDPLKPSRLFFQCDNKELLARTKQLFGGVTQAKRDFPFHTSFMLNPIPPPDFDIRRLNISRMSPTRFRGYLKCPFRFYLNYVLEMQPLDDRKRSLDALEFGTMIHQSLREMGELKEVSNSTDHRTIEAFLKQSIEKLVVSRFGKNPPLPVIMFLDAARERLASTARVQAELVKEGWEIFAQPEKEFEISNFNGMRVTGTIDRIDRHRSTGAFRIIDYKTSDRATKPFDAHISKAKDSTQEIARFEIGGKEYEWTDLQLPIYRMLLEEAKEFRGACGIEVAYFCLPKAVAETNIHVWEDFNDEWLKAARRCAGTIVDAVRSFKFWPPAEIKQDDDYGSLYYGEMPDFLDGAELQEKLKKLAASRAGLEKGKK